MWVTILRTKERSDSDSDFESYSKRQCVDTIDAGDAGEASHMNKVVDRMDAIEKAMKLSISQIESVDQLKKLLKQALNEEKRHEAARWQVEFKNSISCIVCKSLANFPWMVTPCCRIILCVAWFGLLLSPLPSIDRVWNVQCGRANSALLFLRNNRGQPNKQLNFHLELSY